MTLDRLSKNSLTLCSLKTVARARDVPSGLRNDKQCRSLKDKEHLRPEIYKVLAGLHHRCRINYLFLVCTYLLKS